MALEIMHIYGPISIQSYGLCIALGAGITTWLVQKNARFTFLNLQSKFSSLVIIMIMAALCGGRLLYLISEQTSLSWWNFFSFWHGGFSILGGLIGVLIAVPCYAWLQKIPILALLDLLAIYTPLLQSISRLGCFFAGCCYGSITSLPWSVEYTDYCSAAPLFLPLHPTQLYSSILLLLSFFILYYLQNKALSAGILTFFYIMLACTERFIVDFWRGERLLIPFSYYYISIHQAIALSLFIVSFICFITIAWKKKPLPNL